MAAKKYAQLDACLLEACGDIKHLFAQHSLENFQLTILCKHDRYDEEGQVQIKFTVAERYESGPQGNELGEVIQEYIRRKGWDITNNTKLLENKAY